MVDARSWGLSAADRGEGLVCALECARALAGGPPATRRAFLVDGLDAAAMAADTAHALGCICCVVVSFSNPDLRGLAEVRPHAAALLLPHALPLLLARDDWRAGTTAHAVATRLLRLLQMPAAGAPPALANAVTASLRAHLSPQASPLF